MELLVVDVVCVVFIFVLLMLVWVGVVLRFWGWVWVVLVFCFLFYIKFRRYCFYFGVGRIFYIDFSLLRKIIKIIFV